jgi:di/tricarboxylate transporter
MSFDQAVALLVLTAVVAALIWDRWRSDVVALTGAAVLLATGAVRPSEVQGAFASPAIIALASLFVVAYAIELSGLLSLLIRQASRLCARLGALGLWLVIAACGAASAFLNNTPIVVLSAPVVRDVAASLNLSPKRFLIPLSYITVLGGLCTLIGTSTNLLVNDMARSAGQPQFGMFEMTPVGLIMAVAGGLYLFFFGERLLGRPSLQRAPAAQTPARAPELIPEDDFVGHAEEFTPDRPLDRRRAWLSLIVFATIVVVAGFGLIPIAAAAFAGAVLLIILRVISPEQAYGGLRPEVLLLIAGMVVIGISLEVTGLAAAATESLIGWIRPLGPLAALILLYGMTLILTEILSNAAVAVLVTPVAVALAESLGVSPRPFLIGVMMAGSAAFATPFGYQTNVLVFQMGGYSYMDFVRVGLPLNLITWVAAVIAIPVFFPF